MATTIVSPDGGQTLDQRIAAQGLEENVRDLRARGLTVLHDPQAAALADAVRDAIVRLVPARPDEKAPTRFTYMRIRMHPIENSRTKAPSVRICWAGAGSWGASRVSSSTIARCCRRPSQPTAPDRNSVRAARRYAVTSAAWAARAASAARTRSTSSSACVAR